MKKNEFLGLIRDLHVEEFGYEDLGYAIKETGYVWSNYLSQDSFDQFTHLMRTTSETTHKSFVTGCGGELRERTRKEIKLPPKMASVYSSSRFGYLALTNGAEAIGGTGKVIFEKGCRVRGIRGSAPQIDAFIENENIFIEVKCTEIFSSKNIKLSNQYWDYLYGRNNDFGFPEKTKKSQSIEISIGEFGVNNSKLLFDLKQFICHLLGIKDAGLDQSTLIYLYFKPLAKETKIKAVDELFMDLSNQIKRIFTSTPIDNFIKANNITLKAYAINSKVFEPLTETNMIDLLTVDSKEKKPATPA